MDVNELETSVEGGGERIRNINNQVPYLWKELPSNTPPHTRSGNEIRATNENPWKSFWKISQLNFHVIL